MRMRWSSGEMAACLLFVVCNATDWPIAPDPFRVSRTPEHTIEVVSYKQTLQQ
jgi:hypothetical protein